MHSIKCRFKTDLSLAIFNSDRSSQANQINLLTKQIGFAETDVIFEYISSVLQ
jgi:hypothetical protein